MPVFDSVANTYLCYHESGSIFLCRMMEAEMKHDNRSMRRWLLSAAYLGLIALLLACSVLTGVSQNEAGTLRVADGVIQVRAENGDWVSVAGESLFELTGTLAGIDPWMVAGRTLSTNAMTRIAENLQVGDLVYVQGAVLEDDTWVAYSIELADEQNDSSLVLIGVATSLDPWTVNGIELNVTAETDIQDGITEGMIVRVEILLLDDGVWEVLRIAPLGETTEIDGCATIVATIVSVEGDQVQFQGWPIAVTLGHGDTVGDDEENVNDAQNANENEGENDSDADSSEVGAGQTVLAVICVAEDGTLVIVQIVILDVDQGDDGDPAAGGEKALVCHKPDNKNGGKTLSISQSAVPAHLAHGDTLGACP
jgi:hypothetical protein